MTAEATMRKPDGRMVELLKAARESERSAATPTLASGPASGGDLEADIQAGLVSGVMRKGAMRPFEPSKRPTVSVRQGSPTRTTPSLWPTRALKSPLPPPTAEELRNAALYVAATREGGLYPMARLQSKDLRELAAEGDVEMLGLDLPKHEAARARESLRAIPPPSFASAEASERRAAAEGAWRRAVVAGFCASGVVAAAVWGIAALL